MKLEDLNEKWISFSGVYESTYQHSAGWNDSTETANVVYVMLDGHIFEFKEDPLDGYRSSANVEYDVVRPDGAEFNFEHAPQRLFARAGNIVRGKDWYRKEFQGLLLYKSEHDDAIAVAEFGTDNVDDYYPIYTAFIDIKAINDLS